MSKGDWTRKRGEQVSRQEAERRHELSFQAPHPLEERLEAVEAEVDAALKAGDVITVAEAIEAGLEINWRAKACWEAVP